MKKRILALLLGAVMTVGVLTGCGSSDENADNKSESNTSVSEQASVSSPGETEAEKEKEPVTLEWYFNGNGPQQDTQKVEDYVNELLKDYEGLEHVTLHMNSFSGSDYAQQLLLAQTSGKQIDIISTYGLDYTTEVNNGTFLPLDDYLASEEFSDIREELPEWLLETLKVDGVTYVIPNQQQACNNRFLVMPKEYVEYADVDLLNSINLAEGYDELVALQEELERITLAINENKGMSKPVFNLVPTYLDARELIQRDVLQKASGFVVNVGSTEVCNIYATEEFKYLCRKIGEYVANGLYPEDDAVDQVFAYGNPEVKQMNEDGYVAFTIAQDYLEEEDVAKKYTDTAGYECVAIQLNDNFYVPFGWSAGGSGVTSTSENPEEALKFIEVLHTEKGKEIYNALVYGLEDVHYEKLDDNHIKTLEFDSSQGGSDTSYHTPKWKIGNTFNAYLNQAVTDEQIKRQITLNEDPDNQVSELMGFWIDLTPVELEISQCQAVITEYRTALQYGSMGADWEAYYNEFMNKLEAAGMQTVLDELQSQVDAFIASK